METATAVSSFAKSLFLGEIHEDLVFPYPKPDPEEQDKIRGLIARLREIAAELIDPRKVEEQRWVGDDVIAALGEAGLLGLYVRRGVRRPGALADRLLPRLRGVRADRPDAVGDHGRAPVDRDEAHRPVRLRRAEGALPARPRRGPQARRLRADRAERGLRRVGIETTRDAPGRRVMGAERREALHRQRLEGVGARHVRADRDDGEESSR